MSRLDPTHRVFVTTMIYTVSPDLQLCYLSTAPDKPHGVEQVEPGEAMSTAFQRVAIATIGRSITMHQARVVLDSEFNLLFIPHWALAPWDDERFPNLAKVVNAAQHSNVLLYADSYRAMTELYAQVDQPDPCRVLLRDGKPVTLRQLQMLHEAVSGRAFQRDSFRRSMVRSLDPYGGKVVTANGGKPAELYVRSGI